VEKKNSKIDLIRSEVSVYSPTHYYAGTVDAIGKDSKGRLILFDWKTSNFVNSEYALQLAAYCKAFEESEGQKVEEARIVRFNKYKAAFEEKVVDDISKTFEGFQSCLNLWKIY